MSHTLPQKCVQALGTHVHDDVGAQNTEYRHRAKRAETAEKVVGTVVAVNATGAHQYRLLPLLLALIHNLVPEREEREPGVPLSDHLEYLDSWSRVYPGALEHGRVTWHLALRVGHSSPHQPEHEKWKPQ